MQLFDMFSNSSLNMVYFAGNIIEGYLGRFMSFSAVCQIYQDNDRVIMKSFVQ